MEENKYRYWYQERKKGVISDEVVDQKAILFELDKFLKEYGISQRQVEKYSKTKDIEVYQSFLSRFAKGQVKSLNMPQFLSLLVCLSELTGKEVQPNDLIRVVQVEAIEKESLSE